MEKETKGIQTTADKIQEMMAGAGTNVDQQTEEPDSGLSEASEAQRQSVKASLMKSIEAGVPVAIPSEGAQGAIFTNVGTVRKEVEKTSSDAEEDDDDEYTLPKYRSFQNWQKERRGW